MLEMILRSHARSVTVMYFTWIRDSPILCVPPARYTERCPLKTVNIRFRGIRKILSTPASVHRTEEGPQLEMPETQEKIQQFNDWGKYLKPVK